MILDKLSNRESYAAIHPGINQALEAVAGYTPENYETGKVEVDGDRVFYMRNAYTTGQPSVFEAHRKYVDVMVMVEGEETIYVKPTDDLKHITMEYNESQDALLAEFEADATPVHLTAGSFVVLLPQDAHAPNCVYGAARDVKKIVCKVRIAP